MLRSTSQEVDSEFLLAKDLQHIGHVWTAVESAMAGYWQKFLESERKSPSEAEGAILTRVFDKAVSEYEKEAAKYAEFFDEGAMEEYEEDPNAFKQGLTRDVPVIARTLRQSNQELKEWQKHFRLTRPADLLAVFSNVLEFREEWSESHPVDEYRNYDSPAEFGLDAVNEDETMNIPKVVGMGIKTIVLFHLDPQRLPPLGRASLFGLFFLSGKNYFDMPSKSSEFLMINDVSPASDGSIVMDQNYWYPYGAFSTYVLRLYRWIETRAANANFIVDENVRYVYVERFLNAVCDQHKDDMKVMRALDRFGVPG